jgi:hypothetical protein
LRFEADVGRAPRRDLDTFLDGKGVGRKREQSALLLEEDLADVARSLFGAGPFGGSGEAPLASLSVEIIEVVPGAGGEEIFACVANRSFDSSLLIPPCDGHRTRQEAVVRGELEERRVETDRVAPPLQHRALQIVVQQHARNALKGFKGLDVAAHEARHRGSEEEAQHHRIRGVTSTGADSAGMGSVTCESEASIDVPSSIPRLVDYAIGAR